MTKVKELPQVTIYTDGACKGNPGPGGWGALLLYQGSNGVMEKEIYGGEPETTNNRMELMAVIEALKLLKKPCRVNLHMDSVYVKHGMEEWMDNWKRNGWRTAQKKPVKNQELWQQLDEQRQRHHITGHWVKGHTGDPGNERADMLANKGVEGLG